MADAETHGRLGLFHIEEALLQALFAAHPRALHRHELATMIGAPKLWNYSVMGSFLTKLVADGRADVHGNSVTWSLSAEELRRREQ